jgi:hypothetical protein
MRGPRLVSKLSALSGRQLALLVEAVVLVGAVRVGLVVLPFRRLQRWLGRSSLRPGRAASPDSAYRKQVIWAVRAAGRRLLGDKPCLAEALAAQWLLNRDGYPTDLQIGVTKGEDGQLLAHAWLEKEGKTVIGGPLSPHVYTPMQQVSQ